MTATPMSFEGHPRCSSCWPSPGARTSVLPVLVSSLKWTMQIHPHRAAVGHLGPAASQLALAAVDAT